MAGSTHKRIVFIHLPGQVDAVPAAELAMTLAPAVDGQAVAASRLRYGPRYLQNGSALEVDPRSAPLDAQAQQARTPVNGLTLFGAIRDASPDAWGRRVIDFRLRGNKAPTEVDYLDNAGSDRAGALDIRREPTSGPADFQLPTTVELGRLVDAAGRLEAGENIPPAIATLLNQGPTMGGMRPKAVITDNGRQYIAKFPSRRDQFNVPSVEYATLLLAKRAGLDVPELRLIDLDGGQQVMLIERFDRTPVEDGLARRHMVSGLTMVGADELAAHRYGYDDLAQVISQFAPRDSIGKDRTELYKRMVFNILVGNLDDHLRNHAFLLDTNDTLPDGSKIGRWRLSPLYDVVPEPRANPESGLALGVGAYGRTATLENALSGCGKFGLSLVDAARIIEEMIAVVRPWRNAFEAVGIQARDCDAVAPAFRRAADIGYNAVKRALG